jgi:hypothetical protein
MPIQILQFFVLDCITSCVLVQILVSTASYGATLELNLKLIRLILLRLSAP